MISQIQAAKGSKQDFRAWMDEEEGGEEGVPFVLGIFHMTLDFHHAAFGRIKTRWHPSL